MQQPKCRCGNLSLFFSLKYVAGHQHFHGEIITAESQEHTQNNLSTASNGVTKVKRTRRSVPRDAPTHVAPFIEGHQAIPNFLVIYAEYCFRHRWTGRYEAHLWDKNCWNESQNKKGRQEADEGSSFFLSSSFMVAGVVGFSSSTCFDLAALKYWGQDTILNFPVSLSLIFIYMVCGRIEEETYLTSTMQLSTYQKELKEMEDQSREEHHHNGRWEARIGRVFGNKYLYLGTYATQEEAATAYDMAAIEYRGLNAVTNFDLSRYIKWLKPNQTKPENNPNPNPNIIDTTTTSLRLQESDVISETLLTQPRPVNATSALGLLLQSSKFKEMMEMTSAATDHRQSTSMISEPVRCDFPEDIQTYFECQDSSCYGNGDDLIFGELNSFGPSMFQCDQLDA
ncbi:hypothetical protein CXB51_003329 [Gossypium anomalum]|uniref:AP2/ERF domain-containing protein n=1 Tax=Gossypium anomalum TaxID=47600 RepID=A0A8J6DA32_9ROSI|nr:hypothetical protein CXB51_003329 [Gossypium anomalum]